ncbi:MAG TPA: M35 family metallo-endopeptidase [Bacteroidia bacterium]|jgi:hypothetical protein|nr:M35 family metallo-endopeptidase [Bacteroidia bacterium]
MLYSNKIKISDHKLQEGVRSGFFQPKLSINTPGDTHEQEADAMADKVMRMTKPENSGVFFKPAINPIQRKCTGCEKDDKKLNRKEGAHAGMEAVITLSNYSSNNSGSHVQAIQKKENLACIILNEPPSQERFLFKINTSDFTSANEEKRFRDKILSIPPDSPIEVLGMASEEGPASFNEVLSCERATKIAKMILSTGRIVAAVKATGGFPGTQHKPEYRSVALRIVTNKKTDTPTQPQPQPTRPHEPVSEHDSISSCDTTQNNQIKQAIAEARTWINYVEPKMATYKNSKGKSTDQSNLIRYALTMNFHTIKQEDADKIADGISEIKRHMQKDLSADCIPYSGCGPNDLAYVQGAYLINRLSNLHLCPLFFNCTDLRSQASTIIHEIAHQYPGTTDNAYEGGKKYTKLSSSSAMNNADSYAVFVRMVYFDGEAEPGKVKCDEKLTLEQKLKTINAVIDSSWVSDDDISAIEYIYKKSSAEEKEIIRKKIEPQLYRLTSFNQRISLTSIFDKYK